MRARPLLLTLLLPLALLLGGCSSAPSRPTAPADTSANALDWAGTYSGVLPCADCAGILTHLSLADDLSYRISTRHLGRGAPPYTAAGRFVWAEDGRTIKLGYYRGGPGLFLIGENQAFHLDRDGKRIEGDLADRYRLAKRPIEATPSDARLVGRRWWLQEIGGRPVQSDRNARGAAFIEFDQQGQLQGSTGCNPLFADYTLPRPAGLRFEHLEASRGACPDMSVENLMLEALPLVDGYSIVDDSLSLQRARMAPLLRFGRSPPEAAP
jgi:heat shock protein HslJ